MRFWMSSPRLLSKVEFRMLTTMLCIFAFSQVSAAADFPIPSGDVRIHYNRPDGSYSGWTVYAFDNTTENTGNYGGGPRRFRSIF
jgi:pullulanase